MSTSETPRDAGTIDHPKSDRSTNFTAGTAGKPIGTPPTDAATALSGRVG